MMSTSFLILRVSIPIVQFILAILDLALYATAIILIFYKEGQNAWKFRQQNDFDRKTIIETGKDIPIKTAPEYKPWKGFLFGIISTVPLMILLFIHVFVGKNGEGLAAITTILHYVFWLPIYSLKCCFNPSFSPAYGDYFLLLYSVVLMAILTAIGYYLGARKLQRAQDKIEERKKEIAGSEQ